MKKFILFLIIFISAVTPFSVYSQYSIQSLYSNGVYTIQTTQTLPNNTLVYYRFSDGYTLSCTSNSNNKKGAVRRSFSSGSSISQKVGAYIIPKGGPAGYASLQLSNILVCNQCSNPNIQMNGNCLNISHSWHPYPLTTVASIADGVGGSTFNTPTKPWFFLDVTNETNSSGSIDIAFDKTRFLASTLLAKDKILSISTTPPSLNTALPYAYILSPGVVRIEFPTQQTSAAQQRHFLIAFVVSGTNPVDAGKFYNFTANQTWGSNTCSSAIDIEAQGTPHDPNQTLVNPTQVCHLQNPYTPWRYHIDFQNDGTAPAQNVAVKTYLPLGIVNINSFTNVTSSHGSPVASVKSNNSIQFTLNNINLPGTNQNNPEIPYAQTEGWIEFDVMPYACLQAGTASAYSTITFTAPFFSQSMNTNTVTTTIGVTANNMDCTPQCPTGQGQKTAPPSSNNYTIYPNPFTDQFTIQWPEGSEIQTETPVFQIMDATGRTCMLINWSEGQTQQQVDLSGFPAGMYLLYAPTKENGTAVTKIIKQ